MSITVQVGLLSGKTTDVLISLDEPVAALQRRAQTTLGVRKGQLVDSSARALQASATIEDSMFAGW